MTTDHRTPKSRRRPAHRRGIFVKLVTVFLVVGLIPFLGISFWTYHKARFSITQTVIEYWLVRLSREVAVQLDHEVDAMHEIVGAWATDETLAGDLRQAKEAAGPERRIALDGMQDFVRHRQRSGKAIDLVMLVDEEGRVLAGAAADAPGDAPPIVGRTLAELLDPGDLVASAERRWIEGALGGSPHRGPWHLIDCHPSPLLDLARGLSPRPGEEDAPPRPSAYSLGFARPIAAIAGGDDAGRSTAVRGVLVTLFNWTRIHDLLDAATARFQPPDPGSTPLLPEAGRIVGMYDSGYPFLFASDCDLVIGHRYPALLGTRLVEDHGLPDFRDKMLRASFGSHLYEYPAGTGKISGFAATRRLDEGGFGWTVGVGINDTQIYGTVRGLRTFMIISALIVAGSVIVMAAVFSHRITEPITRLIAFTDAVARGNLDARVSIGTKDEIAVLADSFNRMTEDLKATSQRLIQAEKNAAWREMARQVAHEIKNPLTPIVLAAQQVQQAHRDRHPMMGEILEDSMAQIIEQCESLKRIASDFASYAAFPKRAKKPEDLAAFVRGMTDLYRPSADGRTEIASSVDVPPGTQVVIDKDEMRRVFLNLFNNALEAMEGGGRLTVTASLAATGPVPYARIEVKDTGRGIPPEDFAHLFEPYFSTRTGGTGLGLAICKKIVGEHAGRIEVESEVGRGTTFTVFLPVRRESDPGSGG